MMLEATTVGSSQTDSMKNVWGKEAGQECKSAQAKAGLELTVMEGNRQEEVVTTDM